MTQLGSNVMKDMMTLKTKRKIKDMKKCMMHGTQRKKMDGRVMLCERLRCIYGWIYVCTHFPLLSLMLFIMQINDTILTRTGKLQIT